MARPPKISQPIAGPDGSTTTVADVVVEALFTGAFIEDAANAANVAPATIYNWLARGEEHRDADPMPKREAPFVEFLEATVKARAHAKLHSLAVIKAAAQDGDWRAAAWYLEHAHPDDYGRRTRLEHAGEIKTRQVPTVDLDALTDDELKTYAKLKAKMEVDGDD